MPIIGHQPIIEYFQKVIESGNLAHCYLFAGPQNVGKTAVLSQVVSRLIGRPDLEIDLHKPSELRQRYPDFFYLEAEEGDKEITVDQSRLLKREMSTGTLVGQRMIAVIYGAERLNQSSANALLKLLEEPNRQAIIFLMASHRQSVLPTIMSRSVIVDFKPVSTGEIRQALVALGAPAKRADLIARFTSGRPGLAFDYFGNPDKFDTILTVYREILNSLGQPVYRRFGLLAATEAEKLQEFSEVLQIVLRDLMQARIGQTELIANQEAVEDLKQLAARFDERTLADRLSGLLNSSENMVFNINIRLNLEHILQSL